MGIEVPYTRSMLENKELLRVIIAIFDTNKSSVKKIENVKLTNKKREGIKEYETLYGEICLLNA